VDDFGIDSKDLSDFFTAISAGKQKRKKELDETVGDAVDDFFSTISTGKKVVKEKKETLVGDSFDELFLSPLKEEINPKKKKKVQEQKTVKAFEDWLYSETPKKQEKVIEEVIENSLDEVLEVLEEYKEELEEPKDELIEKSLGLLAEPSDVKVQQDPLTPLDQKFATLDDLQKHYKLFLSRIQQQLSTLGGGGETRLRYLDDIVGIATNSGAYNNKFLQWNSTTNQAEFVNPNAVGITSIISISGVTTYYQASNVDDYIGVNANVPVTIVLPQIPSYGKKLIVKDEGNKIATYNITVQAGAGTSVENDSSVIMTINHQSFTYFYNGSNWFLI
jgi:hypothetical protein